MSSQNGSASDFTPKLERLELTSLVTLHCRACDAELGDRSVLSDNVSHRISAKIGSMLDGLGTNPTRVFNVALRTKYLDSVVGDFARRYPEGCVVDLGSGFDPRAERCGLRPPFGWFGVDSPAVNDARRRMYEESDEFLIDGDLRGGEWLSGLDRERPTILVADGLFPFLPADSMRALMRSMGAWFSTAELTFNGYSRLMGRMMQRSKTFRAMGISPDDGLRSGRDLEGWGAGLKLLDETYLWRMPEVASMESPGRIWTRLLGSTKRTARNGPWILHYRFEERETS
ncbi:class I SAM-dependent methyltransferase [Streptomyces sp. NPDC127159]|uniref:class I SAM-dependent methyltransferase n=1 Tax=unclassified Streptomyces TaxID=2593676 RepID=UPI00362CB25E